MSQENVEIVRSFFEASDLETAFELIAENVTYAFHGEARYLSGAEELAGKPAAMKWMVDWFSRFRDYRFEVDEIVDWGDRVLVVSTHNAVGRTSGVPIHQATTQVMTVRDGKIVRQDFFGSREEAVEASGAPE